MTAALLDGKEFSRKLKQEAACRAAEFTAQTGVKPCLVVVLTGANPASEVYVRHKRKACEETGIESRLHNLPDATTTDELLALIQNLNSDASVHGILVQLPLPKQIDTERILFAIDPRKDVDAFHPENVGLLVQGRPRFSPCTPLGIMRMLAEYQVPTAGKHAVIVGRSDIVGKPMANMLVQRGVDATVTITHSRTTDLASVTRLADLLIVAIGQANFVTADMVKPGAVVIDVGMNRLSGGAGKKEVLCGDVDFAAVREVASLITPVPGGVGPLTVAMLLHNAIDAARLQTNASPE